MVEGTYIEIGGLVRLFKQGLVVMFLVAQQVIPETPGKFLRNLGGNMVKLLFTIPW